MAMKLDGAGCGPIDGVTVRRAPQRHLRLDTRSKGNRLEAKGRNRRARYGETVTHTDTHTGTH